MPIVNILLSGILPCAVTNAARLRSIALVGHCANSSSNASAKAKPCIRLGSEPSTFRIAPVSRSVICFRLALSRIPNRDGCDWKAGLRKAITCLKMISPCWKLEATITFSAAGCTNGPSILAAPIAPMNVDFPAPRATDKAAVATFGANAPRKKRRCQGNSSKCSPASRPCGTIRPST